jgi:hypothetical protein
MGRFTAEVVEQAPCQPVFLEFSAKEPEIFAEAEVVEPRMASFS